MLVKINYRNFTRLGANERWAKRVPEELIRRPKILDVWEFVQFLVALVGGAIVVFNAKEIEEWLFLLVPVGFLASALLMAIEHHAFRATSTLSVALGILSIAYFLQGESRFFIVLILGLISVAFVGSMYVGSKAASYYAWCKKKSGT